MEEHPKKQNLEMKFLFETDTRKNKLRTAVTVVGVTWGVFLLVVLLGCARGMENSFNRQFGDFATNSVFVWAQQTSKPFKGYQEGKRPRLQMSDVEHIRKEVDGVEFVVPRNRRSGTVTKNFQTGQFGINGDFPLLDQVEKKDLIRGRFLNERDIQEKRKSVVISKDVYEQFFEEGENPIGDFLEINQINFKIVGIFQNGTIGRPTDLHIPFTTFQQIFNMGNKLGWMMITGQAEKDIRQIEKDTKLLLKNLHKVHPQDTNAFGSFNLGERFAQMTGFLKGMQFLTWFVGIATLIAGVFAIGNILLITVKERTKEIGIRRALGATPVMILRQIVLEALSLAFLAGLFGIIFGGLVLMGIDQIWGQGDDAALVNASVSIPTVCIAIALLAIFGSLVGLIPATRATKIKPIAALNDA
jgi:putative ABC transport system permease protein